ncbi:MAG: helix-turn-helix domain-containing protein [Prevotellaceae bacterium]|jgi:IS30 family transposase|nr:helix-turn-helix domain-containing protein [Prevotellaceae bacterium]
MTHITVEQRYEIPALKKVGCTQSEIAKAVGVSQSAISRELKRNKMPQGGYNAVYAPDSATIGRERFCHERKFTKDVVHYVRDKLEQEQWSPEQIVAYAKKTHVPMVSHERIYRYIRKDKQESGRLYTPFTA